MKKLSELSIDSHVTVFKMKRNKAIQIKLEGMGIIPGVDLKVLKTDQNSVAISTGNKVCELSKEEAEHVIVTELFCRKGDPVLISGCCAFGNTGDIIERIKEYDEEECRED
ncbi:FeoA family protein [Guggenheimella bovis]